jgi:hypothetical protein
VVSKDLAGLYQIHPDARHDLSEGFAGRWHG